jgi:mono/diheme cytochrome c family protein
MKLTKAGMVFVGLQGAVVVAGLFAAASTPPDDKTKAKDQQNIHLIGSLKGVDIYRAHCAACHGADGKGDGPVAPALSIKLPDLTTIAQRNGGVFPAERVKKIIAGDEAMAAHGSREMPVWGPIFHQIQEDRDYGEIRLHNLADYLKSIQK